MPTSPKAQQLQNALAQVDPGIMDMLEVLVTLAIKLLVNWLSGLFSK